MSQSFIHQSTSSAKIHIKSSSLLRYFDFFQSNHTVGCCNINFSSLCQIKREKSCFASCVSIFLLYFLRDCSCFVATFGQLFTLRPPNFFVLAPLSMLIACWKSNFFRMFMGKFWERSREREIFGLKRFANTEAKSYFCTVLRSKSNLFLQFPLGSVKKHAKKKQVYCWLKKSRARRKKCEVLNTHSSVHFPRKVQNFRACKNAKFAQQHPIIFGVLASPRTTLKTEKIAFSWEMKSVSGHLKFVNVHPIFKILAQSTETRW